MIAPEYQQVIPLLALDRTIAFNVAFRKVAGSTVAGLFLSQAWFWTRTEMVQNRDGWFYKSQEEWEEETGLSRREQATARKHLKENGLIEEERRGLDPTLWFRVSGERLAEALRGEYQRTLPDGGTVHQVMAEPYITCSANRTSPQLTEMTAEMTQETTPARTSSTAKDRFDAWYATYPRKVGKQAALASFMRHATNVPLDTLLRAVELQKKSSQWQKDGGQYIPNPSTWLNQGRWDDEVPTGDSQSQLPVNMRVNNDRELSDEDWLGSYAKKGA